MDVEERSGEFVEDEVEAVIVYERALDDCGVSLLYKERVKVAKLQRG